MNGFLNLLKPPGMTSAAVVAVTRRLTGEKRVGHAGTLDPEAAGVLPVMIGRAARLFDYLVDKEKTYVAEVAFGCATDTQDATGRVIATGDAYPSLPQVEEAALQLTGDIRQRPSAFSAIKQGGKPLYALAHAGVQAEAPERTVHIEQIRVQEELPDHGVLMTVRCGRGTYIRTLCHDLGRLCGCPAHMRFLLRAKSGVFTLDTAITLEEAEALAARGELESQLLPPDWPIPHLPRVDVPPRLHRLVAGGAKLPLWDEAVPRGVPLRVYSQSRFWGIAVSSGAELVWSCQLPPD